MAVQREHLLSAAVLTLHLRGFSASFSWTDLLKVVAANSDTRSFSLPFLREVIFIDLLYLNISIAFQLIIVIYFNLVFLGTLIIVLV